jgi:hypothetical protein
MRLEFHQRWPLDPGHSISDVQQSSIDIPAHRLGNLGGRDGEILCQTLGGETWVILNRELRKKREVLPLHKEIACHDFRFGKWTFQRDPPTISEAGMPQRAKSLNIDSSMDHGDLNPHTHSSSQCFRQMRRTTEQ